MDRQIALLWDSLEEQIKFMRVCEREFPFIIKVSSKGVSVHTALNDDLQDLRKQPT